MPVNIHLMPAEMEELNRELARRVEKLEKEANKLGLAVKEKRDKVGFRGVAS